LMISRTIPHFMISMTITDNIKGYFKLTSLVFDLLVC